MDRAATLVTSVIICLCYIQLTRATGYGRHFYHGDSFHHGRNFGGHFGQHRYFVPNYHFARHRQPNKYETKPFFPQKTFFNSDFDSIPRTPVNALTANLNQFNKRSEGTNIDSGGQPILNRQATEDGTTENLIGSPLLSQSSNAQRVQPIFTRQAAEDGRAGNLIGSPLQPNNARRANMMPAVKVKPMVMFMQNGEAGGSHNGRFEPTVVFMAENQQQEEEQENVDNNPISFQNAANSVTDITVISSILGSLGG